jgi:LysM repeat protein
MKKIFIAGLLLGSLFVNAQRITPEEYIATYKEAAIAEMKRSGVPACVTLAQGLLETENGNSDLVKMSNNHFGIKCKKEWTGETVRHTDDAPNECFRKYTCAAESYKDHSDYLKSNQRYASLFMLDVTDYRGWAFGLKRAGYATNPRYPQIVIGHIEKYNLQQYDSGVVIDSTTDSILNITSLSGDSSKHILASAKLVTVDSDLANELKSKTKFNGLKAFFASKGMALIAIATAADIDLSKLLDYNDLDKDGLLKDDQLIYLEKKNKKGNRDVYTALQNESLYDISQNNGVQLKELAQYNNISENEKVKKGTKIKLR